MVKFYESLDSQGRVCIDMPNQTRYQFVRERKAVLDGYGELCYTAIQCALYANGMSDFSPAVHAPELGYRYIK